jgi:hypothetical protein
LNRPEQRFDLANSGSSEKFGLFREEERQNEEDRNEKRLK